VVAVSFLWNDLASDPVARDHGNGVLSHSARSI